MVADLGLASALSSHQLQASALTLHSICLQMAHAPIKSNIEPLDLGSNYNAWGTIPKS